MTKKSDKFKDVVYVWRVKVDGVLVDTAYNNHDAYELLKNKLLDFIEDARKENQTEDPLYWDLETEKIFWKTRLKESYKKNSDRFGLTVYGKSFQCQIKAVSREEFDKWL